MLTKGICLKLHPCGYTPPISCNRPPKLVQDVHLFMNTRIFSRVAQPFIHEILNYFHELMCRAVMFQPIHLMILLQLVSCFVCLNDLKKEMTLKLLFAGGVGARARTFLSSMSQEAWYPSHKPRPPPKKKLLQDKYTLGNQHGTQ